ncbi:hypothetical protein [Symmachiella dynata]|uniref:hypothetical protein n=1 Tax=Symmachiella dynata TaxID=2527995 RepID=UPI0030EC04BB|tara:strand:+ start:203 stop:604 length:402 start_codon:yes stop_codon:yes gene_type:complete
MMATLTIRDESTAGKTLGATHIELRESQVTVEEVIRSYVFQRVKDCNVQRAVAPPKPPLVVPSQDEVMINGTQPAQSSSIDWRVEFNKTKEAFRNQQILVFINEEQFNSLDAVVRIEPSTDIKFLRLTMLMGG